MSKNLQKIKKSGIASTWRVFDHKYTFSLSKFAKISEDNGSSHLDEISNMSGEFS